jgi:hypothetical protein
MSDTPDPGWYPDPDDASRARYWDGQGWTDRTGERSAIEASSQAGPSGPPSASTPLWRRPLTAALAVGVLALALVGFVVLSSNEASAEVILQPSAAPGVDPFTDSVATSEVALAGGELGSVSGGAPEVESLSGATPGLYGGTGKEQVCDPEALVAFLAEHSEKAAAFAAALQIKPREIEEYVSSLTPLLLREDTRVTNHGFADGQATPFDAVLEAGTAVLVDDRGVPRVRCACGNPLSAPTAIDSSPSYSGETWEGFDEQRLVAVTPAKQQLDSFEVVDVETGESYEQGVGAGTTRRDLLNAEIPAYCGQGRVQLADGVYEGPAEGLPNDQYRVAVAGIDNPQERTLLALGDLTGDGLDEGLVIVNAVCGSSGSSIKQAALVYSGQSLLAELPVEDAVAQITGDGRYLATDARIDGGAAVIEVDAARPGACNACLTEKLTTRFTWNGSEFLVEAGGRELSSGGSSSTSGAAAGGRSQSPTGRTKGSTDCGGGVSVGRYTSCPFGRNVAEKYRASGGKTRIRVYSPVTELTYTMRCSSGSPHVCTGGDQASVYFP